MVKRNSNRKSVNMFSSFCKIVVLNLAISLTQSSVVGDHGLLFRIGQVKDPAAPTAVPIDFSYDGEHRLSGLLGVGLPTVIESEIIDCSSEGDPPTICRSYGDYANVTITDEGDDCARIVWTSLYTRRLEDCFRIDKPLYGGPESLNQYWPINPDKKNEAPYVSSDFLTRYNDFGNLIENYWLLSNGVALHVDEDNPLLINYDTKRAGEMCFVSADRYPYSRRSPLTLKYTVCTGNDVKSVHLANFPKWYKKPQGLPDTEMLLRPLWSTWARYGPDINQEIVQQLARDVVAYGFGNSSHIEIDDKWETCYGQEEFDPQKFPDPRAMVNEVKSLNLRVTLWVHPFINFDCPLFETGVKDDYFIKDGKGKATITGWWAGDKSGAIDVTNERSASWWRDRLEKLRTDFGIDSFKFDAGEVNWIPYSSILEGPPELAPNSYSTKYVEAIAPLGGLIETRVGRLSQEHPIFTRIMDRDSHWRHDAGLKSVIPTVLLFGILGYPFILPDMVGGSGPPSNPFPSKDLYLRWVQVNVFMPAMQLSIFPWDEHYDEQTIETVKNMLNLREQFKEDILAAANQAIEDGSPINRPMWWVDPTDPETFEIDQAFMLGDRILVAPVVEEYAIARDIYLPTGTWLSGISNINVTGPIWLRNYPVPQNMLAYFIKM